MKGGKHLFVFMVVSLIATLSLNPPAFVSTVQAQEGPPEIGSGRRLYCWVHPTHEFDQFSSADELFNEYFMTSPYYASVQYVLAENIQMPQFLDWFQRIGELAQDYPAIEIMITVAFDGHVGHTDWDIFTSFLDELQSYRADGVQGGIYSVGINWEHSHLHYMSTASPSEKQYMFEHASQLVEARGFRFVSYYTETDDDVRDLPYLKIGATNWPDWGDPEYTLDWDLTDYHIGQDAGGYTRHTLDNYNQNVVRKIIQHGLGIIGDHPELKDDQHRHFIGFVPSSYNGDVGWNNPNFRSWVETEMAPYLWDGTGSMQDKIVTAIGPVEPPPPTYSLSLSPDETSVRVGETVTFTSRLMYNGTPIPGETVNLYLDTTNLGVMSDINDGYYSLQDTQNSEGTYIYHAEAPNLGIRSSDVTVYVAPEGGYQLNLKVMDWDLTETIQGAYVYMDNETQSIKVSDSNGWTNWTGVSGYVQIRVKYYGFWVNGTFSVNVNSSKTIDVRCKLYDVTVTVKPNNDQGVITTVNVTAFNSTSASSSNKIRSGITANWTGTVTLKNLPNNTITFTVYAKSDYSVVIANTTQLISLDDQSFNIIANQNHGSVSTTWQFFVLVSGLNFVQLRKAKREGG